MRPILSRHDVQTPPSAGAGWLPGGSTTPLQWNSLSRRPHVIGGKVDIGEELRDMGIPDAVGIHGPATGILGGFGFAIGIEAGKVHPPGVAGPWRHGAAIALGQNLQARPGERQFDRPAAIAIGTVVERTLDRDRALYPRQVPVEKAEPRTARVTGKANAVLGLGARRSARELGQQAVAAPLIGVLPEKEGLVHGAQRVDLELVIAIRARHEELDVVLAPDQ